VKTNYFAFFNLNESIEINKDELEIAYITKAANQNDSQLANEYYEILLDDIKRLEHFCDLKEIILNAEVGPDFLIRFYELNEEIESMNEIDKNRVLKEIKLKLNQVFHQLSQNFEIGNMDGIKKLYNEAKYLNRIIENNKD
jgi:hypothetical protein